MKRKNKIKDRKEDRGNNRNWTIPQGPTFRMNVSLKLFAL